VFGCIKIAQVRWWLRWWHHFSTDLGSHVCAEQLFQCGEKCVYVEEYEGFSLEWSTNIPNADLCCGCHFHGTITTQVCAETISGTWSTTFDHIWPQKGHGDEVILASVYNWTQQHWHETMSQRMGFVFGMISGSLVSWESSLFRWMCSLLQLHRSWNIFWGETESLLHAWDVRPPATHDGSAGGTASYIIGPYFFDGTVSGVNMYYMWNYVIPEPSNNGIM